jgi:hypothetical protein
VNRKTGRVENEKESSRMRDKGGLFSRVSPTEV